MYLYFFGHNKIHYMQSMKQTSKNWKVTDTIIISIFMTARWGCEWGRTGWGGGAGRDRCLGSGWSSGRLGLGGLAAFTGLPLQNHLPGDAGHLTVGHCVHPISARCMNNLYHITAHQNQTFSINDILMALTFDGLIHFACQAGLVLQRKMKSTSGQSLVWEVLRKRKQMFFRNLVWCTKFH